MRLQDWPERLGEYLNQSFEFNWTTCNCALFAADAVIAVTGEDFATPYRGPKTERGMITRLLRVCGGDVTAAATRELGDPVSVKLAGRGDVIAFDLGEGMALGVCNGLKSVFISENGLVLVPTLKCEMAWKI